MAEDKKYKKQEVKPLVMTITMTIDGKMEVGFSLLNNQTLSYGFLKMAEKTLDNFYAEQIKANQTNIVRLHNVMDFVRNKH